MKRNKKLVYFLVASAIIVSGSTFTGSAFADNVRGKSPESAVELGFDRSDTTQRIFGKVASINGNTIMITDNKGTLYSVNIANIDSQSPLKVGDEVSVRGTINAVGIVATS